MEEMKSLFASRTFWGAVVAILAGISGGGKYALAPGEQAEFVDLLVAVGAAGGGLAAIAGRVLARARIGKTGDRVARLIADRRDLFGIVAFMALVFLAGCGFTPQGEVIRSQAFEKGGQAYDYGLDNAELFVCQIASVGSVKRRYWGSQLDFETWAKFCQIGAEARGLKLDVGPARPQEGPPAQPTAADNANGQN